MTVSISAQDSQIVQYFRAHFSFQALFLKDKIRLLKEKNFPIWCDGPVLNFSAEKKIEEVLNFNKRRCVLFFHYRRTNNAWFWFGIIESQAI